MKKKQMGRKPKVPHEVQLRIFYDCLISELSIEEVGVKYGVSTKYATYLYYRWKNKPPTDIEQRIQMEEDEKSKEAALEARIKELETRLAYSNLEIEALKRLIDFAEAHFDIDIVKKGGSQQQNTSK